MSSLHTDQLVGTLEAGIRAVQQGLFQFHRAPLREVGLSLHLAAFAAACLGIQHASDAEMEVADLHDRIEKALRHLCGAWDDRPVARTRRSLFRTLLHLTGEAEDEPEILGSEALYVAVPDADDPEPGDRGDYAVACYRRYVDGVFLFSCDARGPGTWDEAGREFALERALFRDVYASPVNPTVKDGRGVFGATVHAYRDLP